MTAHRVNYPGSRVKRSISCLLHGGDRRLGAVREARLWVGWSCGCISQVMIPAPLGVRHDTALRVDVWVMGITPAWRSTQQK